MTSATIKNTTMTPAQKAEAIKKGLRRLGRNRIAAMSVHKTLDLIDKLEALAAELEQELANKR